LQQATYFNIRVKRQIYIFIYAHYIMILQYRNFFSAFGNGFLFMICKRCHSVLFYPNTIQPHYFKAFLNAPICSETKKECRFASTNSTLFLFSFLLFYYPISCVFDWDVYNQCPSTK